MEKKFCYLKYPYLSVKTQTENSFGGNQTWSSNLAMRKFGCGVIGISDVLLYLGLHRSEYETDLFHGILREDGYISYPRYDRYLMKMRRRYLPVIPFLGVTGWMLSASMNKYFRHYRIGLRAGWGVRPKRMLSVIEEMLRQDIPVILAVGPNFPLLWGRRKLTFYRQENGEYVSALDTKAHFVVVTGMENGYLQVSSWGKEYYISWQEYLHYVKKHSCFLGSNICRIREKKRKGNRG